MKYAIVDHLTREVLNIVECAEHEIDHVLVGLHLKVPAPEGVSVGDTLKPEPVEAVEPTEHIEPAEAGDAAAH